VYDALLRGTSSNLVVHTPFARHRQAFKAREYVVFESPKLPIGDTLHAFLPRRPTINKTPSGIEIEGVEYLAAADLTEEQKEREAVQDVVILGEVTVHGVPVSSSCSWPDPTGTFFVGSIPYSWPCETVRRASQLSQGLCTSPMCFYTRHRSQIPRYSLDRWQTIEECGCIEGISLVMRMVRWLGGGETLLVRQIFLVTKDHS
jgi:hypothetical protein